MANAKAVSENPDLAARSLCLLLQTNSVRKSCIWVIRRPEFDYTVLGLITANAVMMAMNDPLTDDPPWLKVVELVRNFSQSSPVAISFYPC